MSNINLAIIGVGQLGSRYLEGIVKSNSQLSIFLVDPSQASLNRAVANLNGQTNGHQLILCPDFSKLPEKLDLVIVSTNADVRAKVTQRLLSEVQFSYLILEKVLFQSPKDILEIEELINQKSVTCWVNHPKRIFKSYQTLKSYLPDDQIPLGLMATGTNWGIACNGLHVLDTWSYLIDDFLENCQVTKFSNWEESHRKGFKDLQGSLLGTYKKGTPFILSSYPGSRTPLSIYMDYPKIQVFIEEVNGEESIKIFNKDENKTQTSLSFTQEYQSSISAALVDQILSSGTCGLPSYKTAKINHLPFLAGLSVHYFETDSSNPFQILPIT